MNRLVPNRRNKRQWLKLVLLGVALAAVAAFVVLDLGQYGQLEQLKALRQSLLAAYQQQPALFALAFFVIYVLVTALSLPIAAGLSLLAGALFGFVLALPLVSFASTLGATLAFLLARFIGQDWVERRYGKQLMALKQSFAREGAFYLFALRLLPLLPFFVVNILMALLPIRAKTFYWVSQLGMLPATCLFVYAGTQLGQVTRLSDLTSPSLLAAFAAIGLFPLLAKKLLGLLRR